MQKDEVIRAYITSTVANGEWPRIPIPVSQELGDGEVKERLNFWGLHTDLVRSLCERTDNNSELPSLERLKDVYGFVPLETGYSRNDLYEILSEHHYRETVIAFTKILGSSFDDINLPLEMQRFIERVSLARNVNRLAATVNLHEQASELAAEYLEIRNRKPIKCGFGKIDEHCPMQRGQFGFYIGRTNGGKTLSLIHNVVSFMDEGMRVSYINMELTRTQVVNRMLVESHRHNADELRFGEVEPEEWVKSVEDMTDGKEVLLVTRKSDAEINFLVIEEKIKRDKPDIVVIDYMGLIDDADFSWEASPSVSKRLKDMALKHDCLIISAVQSNEYDGDKIPSIENIAKLKALAHDADFVIGMLPHIHGDGIDRELKILMEYKVQKSREGSYPAFSYVVWPKIGRWECEDPEYGKKLVYTIGDMEEKIKAEE